MATPTQRSLKKLREDGYIAQVVEHYNQFARRRIDLFNVIDIAAIKPDNPGVLGIQTTSTSNISARQKKALASAELLVWLQAGNRFEIWGWAKRGPRGKRKTYQLKCISLSTVDFSDTMPQGSQPSSQ